MSRQELRSTGGNCQGDDKQESYSSAGICQADGQTVHYVQLVRIRVFPGGLSGKDSACNVGDLGLIPRLERSHGGGNGNPLQYSCLGNSMDRGIWQVTVHGLAKSQTRLSN